MNMFNINLWVVFGLAGQALFFGRFLLQWLHSERKGESSIPISFWYLSIGGGIILFIYALHIKDIVFGLGQILAILIYVRNLVLIQKKKSLTAGMENSIKM